MAFDWRKVVIFNIYHIVQDVLKTVAYLFKRTRLILYSDLVKIGHPQSIVIVALNAGTFIQGCDNIIAYPGTNILCKILALFLYLINKVDCFHKSTTKYRQTFQELTASTDLRL